MRKNGKTQTAADIDYARLERQFNKYNGLTPSYVIMDDMLEERISTIKTVHRCTACDVWVHENNLIPLSLGGYYGHNSRYLGTNNDELVEICCPVISIGIRLVTNHGRVLSSEQVKEYPIV